MKKLYEEENIGIFFGFIHALLGGMFPVIVSQGVSKIPPLFFASFTTLLAATVAFCYTLQQKKFSDIRKKKSYIPVLLVTLFNIVIPHLLFFTGAAITSNLNIVMFLLSEIIFTLIFTQFIGEKTTLLKILGAGGIFLGGFFILYNGAKITLNWGDILIILSTTAYPLGNFFSKKALNIVSPSLILFLRFFIGGLALLLFSFVIESTINIGALTSEQWLMMALTGVIVVGIGKIMWYESLKRLDISKAVSIGMTFPFFSLIALIVFLQEKLSIYQTIGIGCMLVGVFLSVYRKSVPISATKYAPDSAIEG